MRITAQLIHAASDQHLWARTYDRELSDVLTVQGEVAREIADSISLRLTPQERAQLSRSDPVNPEIALLYFKGSYFLNKLDAPRAEEAFTKAIHLDPNSADSWAGLADALHTMGAVGQQYDAFPRARDAANKALEIDPSQPRALMVLGVVSFDYDWNPTESEAFSGAPWKHVLAMLWPMLDSPPCWRTAERLRRRSSRLRWPLLGTRFRC